MSNSKRCGPAKILDLVKADKRTSLTAPEGKTGLRLPTAFPFQKRAWPNPQARPPRSPPIWAFPVVMKIVSPDILHKTEAGGVMGRGEDRGRRRKELRDHSGRTPGDTSPNAQRSKASQVQQMLLGGQEVIVGGRHRRVVRHKLVAFGLGGVLVEVLKDITFPARAGDQAGRACRWLDGIQAHEMLKGRAPAAIPANTRDAIRRTSSSNVSTLITDFPRDRRDGSQPGVRDQGRRNRPPTVRIGRRLRNRSRRAPPPENMTTSFAR